MNSAVVAKSSEYTFSVEGTTNLKAHFRAKEYTITVGVKGQGAASGPDAIPAHGDQVIVKAVPTAGNRFVNWTENGEVVSSEIEYSFTAQGDRSLTANFVPVSYSVDIEVTGQCGQVKENWVYEPTVKVTLTAVVKQGYEFFGWVDLQTGQEVETNTVLAFEWKKPRKLMARFRPELIAVDGSSLTAVVGKQITLGNYVPADLVELPSYLVAPGRKPKQVRQEVAAALEGMAKAALADGVTLYVDSAYRSYDTQNNLFYRYAGNEGIFKAERYSARPGQSEHQLGTAVDFGGTSVDYKTTFFNTAQGTWLFNNAHKFGFALSYPRNSEEITGYIYEPWHYRYIGEEPAVEWKESGLTLIEFLTRLNQAE